MGKLWVLKRCNELRASLAAIMTSEWFRNSPNFGAAPAPGALMAASRLPLG